MEPRSATAATKHLFWDTPRTYDAIPGEAKEGFRAIAYFPLPSSALFAWWEQTSYKGLLLLEE